MNKALTYAQDTLGVHEVHEKALASRASLDECFTSLDKALDRKRELTEAIADREVDLLSDERGKHSDLSQTAFDSHFKAAKGKDSFLRTTRHELNGVLSEIQGLEFDIELSKTDIRIAVGRMEELGGYLNYLAAVKAETTDKTTKPEGQNT